MVDAIAGGGTPVSLGSLVVSILGNTDSYEKAILRAQNMTAKAGAALEQVAGKVERAGMKLTAAFTVPILGIGVASVKAFATFDDSMTKSLALFGNVSSGMRAQMEATAQEIAGTSVTSADELAKTYGVLARAGFDAQQAQGALATVQQFAAANGIEATAAARELADAQRVLGLRSFDVAQNTKNLTTLEDELMKTSLLSGESVEELGEALEHHGGAAIKKFNVPLSQGLALLTSFANQGVKGARAGAALSEYLESHGGQAPHAAALEREILGATGLAAETARRRAESFTGQLEIVQHNVEAVGVAIGKDLVPYVKQLNGYVLEATQWWKELDPQVRKTAEAVGLVAAAAGPAAMVLGHLGTAFGTVGVASAAALAAVPVAIASWTDMLGLTKTGLLELENQLRISGVKVSTWAQAASFAIGDGFAFAEKTVLQGAELMKLEFAGLLDGILEKVSGFKSVLKALAIFDPVAKAALLGFDAIEAARGKDLGDTSAYYKKIADLEKDYQDRRAALAEANAKAFADDEKERLEDAAKAAKEKLDAAKQENETRQKNPEAAQLDLVNDKLKEHARLQREAANQAFLVTSLRRFALNGPGGLARAVTGASSGAAPNVTAAAATVLGSAPITGTINLGTLRGADVRAAALANGMPLPGRNGLGEVSKWHAEAMTPARVEDDVNMTRVGDVSNPLIAGRSNVQLQTLQFFLKSQLRQLEILTEVVRSRTLPATVR